MAALKCEPQTEATELIDRIVTRHHIVHRAELPKLAALAVMRTDRDDHDAGVARIFSMTRDLTLPEGACGPCRALRLGAQVP